MRRVEIEGWPEYDETTMSEATTEPYSHDENKNIVLILLYIMRKASQQTPTQTPEHTRQFSGSAGDNEPIAILDLTNCQAVFLGEYSVHSRLKSQPFDFDSGYRYQFFLFWLYSGY